MQRIITVKGTNQEGLYLFPNIEEGHYVVRAKLEEGYEFEKEYHIGNRGHQTLNDVLKGR